MQSQVMCTKSTVLKQKKIETDWQLMTKIRTVMLWFCTVIYIFCGVTLTAGINLHQLCINYDTKHDVDKMTEGKNS